jgi:hypothetical protein
MRRARFAVGLVLASIAGFLLLAPGPRASVAVHAMAAIWPYLLAIFVISSGFVALTDPRRLIGPVVLAIISLVGVAYRYHSLKSHLIAYWPLALLAAAAVMTLSGHTARVPSRLAAVAWTTRWVLRDQLSQSLRVTCVLGAVHIDLRDTTLAEDSVATITTIGGCVWIKIPAHWPVVLDGLPSALVPIEERGRRDGIDMDSSKLRLRSGGAAGYVVVERW